MEAVTPLKSSDETAHGDYILTVCLDRESFQAISQIIFGEQQQMMVVVEGRRPLCWACKKLDHIKEFALKWQLPLKPPAQPQAPQPAPEQQLT